MKVVMVPLKLSLTDSNVPCVDFEETKRRTKRMISFDKGFPVSEISLFDDLVDNLDYTARDKRDLKPLIDSMFFADVKANANRSDLERASTVRDLAGRIFTKYIQTRNRC